MRFYNRIRYALVGVMTMLAACQDLDVVNENAPDNERALQQPDAVEVAIQSAFTGWRGIYSTGTDVWGYYPIISSEFARTSVVRTIQPSAEPRQMLRNDPTADEVWIPRSPWDRHLSGLATAVDALRRITVDGLRIMTPVNSGTTTLTDNTDRARIWGKIAVGLQLGYCGMIFDRCPVYTHEDQLPEGYDDVVKFEVEKLGMYPEVIAKAVSVLEEAIADIDRSPAFSLPGSSTPVWVNQELTSAQLRQMANTLIARLMVYSTRTPQERQAVNWQKVLTHTAAGLTYDFGPTLQTGVVTASWYTSLQGTRSEDNIRPHYSLIGPADTSGAYQAWVAKPFEQRDRFDIRTPDRRITGPTPTSQGAYFRYRTDNNGFDASRGTYNFSAYQWYRNNGSSNSGQLKMFTVDENNLLRAEAMLRTNNVAEAARLINLSRTRSQRIGTTTYPGLPAVTAAGVPQSTGCVPRTSTGACGTLLDALKYERGIELAGMDPYRGWFDRRGFGQLLPGTILHLPIPARYLVSMGIPLYSFGGVGGEGAAQ